MSTERFVITISHQVGSGGAFVGQKLSERLAIPFVDREILHKVAEQLNLAEAELERREERLSSFWETFGRAAALTDPAITLAPAGYLLTDKDLFQLESDYIGRIAEKASAVILGRCGQYILRNHPRRLDILLHADLPTRVKRVSELFHLSSADAEKYILENDKDRSAYIHAFTRQDWLDARLYDLCVDTSNLGLEKTVTLVMACVEGKFR